MAARGELLRADERRAACIMRDEEEMVFVQLGLFPTDRARTCLAGAGQGAVGPYRNSCATAS